MKVYTEDGSLKLALEARAIDIEITDAGNYYSSADVEGALQEAGSFHENSMILAYMALFNR